MEIYVKASKVAHRKLREWINENYVADEAGKEFLVVNVGDLNVLGVFMRNAGEVVGATPVLTPLVDDAFELAFLTI